MTVKLNPQALEHAKQLLDDDLYMINTSWNSSAPTAEQERRYLESNTWDDYGKWYLGIDSDQSADSPKRYQLPYGNFQKLHRSGVIAARQRAAQEHQQEIVDGADELLDLLDRLNAC